MDPNSAARNTHLGNHGVPDTITQPQQAQTVHKKHTSSSSLFSKFSFSRSPSDHQKQQPNRHHQQQHSPREADENETSHPPPPERTIPIVAPIPRPPISIASALQQQKTRRRRGSLRKVALLGRGAQRERREAHRANLSIDVKQAESFVTETMGNNNANNTNTPNSTDPPNPTSSIARTKISRDEEGNTLGLGISDITPRPSMDGYARRSADTTTNTITSANAITNDRSAGAGASLLASTSAGASVRPKVETDEPTPTSPTISYTTTDDEDALHMKRSPLSRGIGVGGAGPAELASLSSGSDSFFGHHVDGLPRRRTTFSRARSPLVAATSLLSAEDDWDYSETEWWGWVILVVTWVVFVVGMGSVFGVWNWAWDVGTTPYAPPELEDDPTLPITGYYPCLMILTCVMAWVWVVSAWVGMKYFRHAKISGD